MNSVELFDADKASIGVLQTCHIQKFDRIMENEVHILTKIEYSSDIWRQCMDAVYFKVECNDDIFIEKDHVSVNAMTVVMTGLVTSEALMEVI